MKYAILGAGGMGIQYGVLLQEHAHADVDFIDAWTPNVERIRAQGGAYVSQDGEGRHLVPIDVYYPEEYDGDPDVWISSSSSTSCRSSSNASADISARTSMCSRR